MEKINLTAVLVDRANYGRLRSLLVNLEKDINYNLKIIATGTMILDNYGNVINEIIEDGFKDVETIEMECAGNSNLALIKSVSLGMLGAADALKRNLPDAILTIGDRYEILSFAVAANFMGIKIIHLQGGELSGCFDDTTRHVMTKLSHLHFVATVKSKNNVLQMGENPGNVFNVGCPSLDSLVENIRKISLKDLDKKINSLGVGDIINFNEKFIVVLHHPDTLNQELINKEITSLQDAIGNTEYQVIWFWPNIDPGSNIISKQIRKVREANKVKNIRFIKHLQSEFYGSLLDKAACLVGNSSSFVRESAILGVPVVLIGDRQKGRETNENVINTEANSKEISTKLKLMISKERFPSSNLYGDGNANKEIKKHLPKIQKIVFEKKFWVH